jgi:predicted phosphodiesterase
MTMIWETDGNLAHHYVDWGHSNFTEHTLSSIETLQIDATHFVHRATIPGLETETSYVYRVRSGNSATATFSFTTAPKTTSPFVTAWWGDNHNGTVTLATHVTNLLAHAPNMICVAGDMVNFGNAISEWHDYWFKPLETLNAAQTTPVIYARGNHDGEHALSYAYSTLPGNEAWFAFDYGNSRFIFLDSETGTSSSPEQYNWLQAELNRPETQRAAFRIVCFHRPPYVNVWNGGGYTGETFVRNDWVPLFTQKNVDIVISGHQHSYQRGATNGTVYIVSGGGGGYLDTEIVADWPFVQVEYSQYHFDIMEVNGPVLSWETFNDSNQLLDMFTLQSRVPVVAWQSSSPSGGTLALTVSGKPGTSYVLESSTNLVNWTSVVTNTIPVTGPPTFTNSVPATSAFRSFRARASQ